MRVYENKWFHRWALGEVISEKSLLNAASAISKGVVEADLGGYLFKKRLARVNEGKSGGYRTIVGFRGRNSERIIFLYAFPKSDRGNISGKEKMALSLAAQAFLSATDSQIEMLIAGGLIWEVQQNE
jgi:hypothetical protein